MVFLQIVSFSLVIISLINIYLNWRLSQKGYSGKAEEYYSLRLRFDSFLAGLAIVIAAAGFIGYNTVEGIKNDFNEQIMDVNEIITKQKSSVDEYEIKLKEIELSIINSEKGLDGLLNQVSNSEEGVQLFINKLKNELIPQQQKIENLEQKALSIQNSLSATNIFTVNNLKTDGDAKTRDIVYFKDLLTIDGRNLPNFEHQPLVLVWVDIDIEEREGFMIGVEKCESIRTEGFVLPGYASQEVLEFDALIIYPIKS